MAAVETLVAMAGKRHIVVAGEMLELGSTGEELHRECGRKMPAGQIDFLLGVRGSAEAMVAAARENGLQAEFVKTPEEAGEWLAQQTRAEDAVLLKASRGVKLERALKIWQQRESLPSDAGGGH